MERGTREAPPQEYGAEQLRADLINRLQEESKDLDLDLQSQDQRDADAFEEVPKHVKFKRGGNNEVGVEEELKNCTDEFIERELERESIRQRKAAIERVIARFSGK